MSTERWIEGVEADADDAANDAAGVPTDCEAAAGLDVAGSERGCSLGGVDCGGTETPRASAGSPAGGATGAEPASMRDSCESWCRSERSWLRCTSAAPATSTPGSGLCSLRSAAEDVASGSEGDPGTSVARAVAGASTERATSVVADWPAAAPCGALDVACGAASEPLGAVAEGSALRCTLAGAGEALSEVRPAPEDARFAGVPAAGDVPLVLAGLVVLPTGAEAARIELSTLASALRIGTAPGRTGSPGVVPRGSRLIAAASIAR